MQNKLIEEVMAAEIFLFEYGPRGSLGNVLDNIPIDFSEPGMKLHAKRAACFIGAAADRIKGSVGPDEAAAFLAVISTGTVECIIKEDFSVSHSLMSNPEKASEAFEKVRRDYAEGKRIRGSAAFCFLGQASDAHEDRSYPIFIERRGGLLEDVPLEKVSFDNFQYIWESARYAIRVGKEIGDLARSLADKDGRIPEEYAGLINDRFSRLLEQDTLS